MSRPARASRPSGCANCSTAMKVPRKCGGTSRRPGGPASTACRPFLLNGYILFSGALQPEQMAEAFRQAAAYIRQAEAKAVPQAPAAPAGP